MRTFEEHYGKWLTAESDYLKLLDVKLTNLCLISCEVSANQALGFSVFEPRDFNADLVERLESRRSKFEGCKFVLRVPPFLKQRAESLAGGRGIEIRATPFVHVAKVKDRFHFRDRIRVVNVDDSPTLLKFLKHTLSELNCVDILEQVSDPRRAAETILKLNPDLVTMDIQMPGRTGVEVVQELLGQRYFPVIMVSSLNLEEGSLVFSALNAGAFDYLQKPKMEDAQNFREELLTKMLLAVNAKQAVARARLQSLTPAAAPSSFDEKLLWCLGASTGGTQALTQFFTSLPAHIPPTLVVQHIPPVFSKAFADSVNQLVPFTVKEAEDGEPILPDHAYIAPGGIQMGVQMRLGKLHIRLSDDPPMNRFKPSVDYLFLDVSGLKDRQIVAGIFTGMGRDGAEAMLKLKNLGSYNIAQDEKSCAVYGMPRAAVELNAAHAVLPLDQIAQAFLNKSANLRKAV